MHATGKQMRKFQAKQEGTWFMITAVVMASGGTITLWCILKINVVEVMSRQRREGSRCHALRLVGGAARVQAPVATRLGQYSAGAAVRQGDVDRRGLARR